MSGAGLGAWVDVPGRSRCRHGARFSVLAGLSLSLFPQARRLLAHLGLFFLKKAIWLFRGMLLYFGEQTARIGKRNSGSAAATHTTRDSPHTARCNLRAPQPRATSIAIPSPCCDSALT